MLGEAGVEQLLKTTIEAAVGMKAIKPAELERIIVDSTVQEKAIAHPTDSRLLSCHNNHLENLLRLRPWAMGRKAWLFAGSELAGQRAAIVMSLVQSARLYGHEPWAYMKDVLERFAFASVPSNRGVAAAPLAGAGRALRYCAVMNIDISKLDEAELVELNRRIVARLKYLQEARTHHQMLNFNVGDRVTFHPPGHDPKTGVIVKYNRKTVTVLTDDHHQWNVAPVFLSRVVEADSGENRSVGQIIRLPLKP